MNSQLLVDWQVVILDLQVALTNRSTAELSSLLLLESTLYNDNEWDQAQFSSFSYWTDKQQQQPIGTHQNAVPSICRTGTQQQQRKLLCNLCKQLGFTVQWPSYVPTPKTNDQLKLCGNKLFPKDKEILPHIQRNITPQTRKHSLICSSASFPRFV